MNKTKYFLKNIGFVLLILGWAFLIYTLINSNKITSIISVVLIIISLIFQFIGWKEPFFFFKNWRKG